MKGFLLFVVNILFKIFSISGLFHLYAYDETVYDKTYSPLHI